jgi:hypothetical protein
MGSFVADYHETEEAFPLVYDLGRISLEWNMVEQFFTATIWELLGHYPTGMALTGRLGNISKADAALRLARERIKDKDVLSAIEFACNSFNILRVNRNALLNAHSIFRGENGEKPSWRRATGKGPVGHANTEADLADLEQLIGEICDLGKFVVALVPFLHKRHRKRWQGGVRPGPPDRFSMPDLLAQTSEPSDEKVATRARSAKKSTKAARSPRVGLPKRNLRSSR